MEKIFGLKRPTTLKGGNGLKTFLFLKRRSQKRRKIFGEEGGEEQQKRKRRETFGEGKYFFAGEKEKEVNIWSRKMFFGRGD